ncbi:MAG: DUF167 domain-containing protein [Spirochaetaceae bacterium]|jgi:uncharacterized protein (TIGR00251 family)|nr:DUF167 domain-containing protein [Spirochaetaceae bacterium]
MEPEGSGKIHASPLRTGKDRLFLDIKVVPGSSKSEIAGVKDGRLRIRIAAAPEGGRANSALIAYLAKALGCPKKDVALHSGEKSRLKTAALPPQLRERAELLLR